MKDSSDEELVRACLNSPGRVFRPFEQLVKRHETAVNKLCLRYSRNEEMAEEIAQEAFVKAYNQLQKLQEPSQFKSWLMRITNNLCTDYYRKMKRREKMKEELIQKEQIESKVQNNKRDELQAVVHSLQKIEEKDRDIIVLYYFSELSIREISESLELGESAVKMRLKRAREKILQILKKCDP